MNWCSGHVGITLNEEVDKLAKNALNYQSENYPYKSMSYAKWANTQLALKN